MRYDTKQSICCRKKNYYFPPQNSLSVATCCCYCQIVSTTSYIYEFVFLLSHAYHNNKYFVFAHNAQKSIRKSSTPPFNATYLYWAKKNHHIQHVQHQSISWWFSFHPKSIYKCIKKITFNDNVRRDKEHEEDSKITTYVKPM